MMHNTSSPRPSSDAAFLARFYEVTSEMGYTPVPEPKPVHDPTVGRAEAIYRHFNGWPQDRR